MPAKPRWLLSIPDAISQLENVDRTLLTRRDIELASLPEGVTVERDRIEVRFSGAKNATERLYALAYALVTTTNGSRRSSTGEPAGGGGDGMTTEALTGRLREGARSYANWHCPSRPDEPNGGPA